MYLNRFLVEKRTNMSIKCLRTYTRSEFTYLEFENNCKEARIEMHKTTIYTTQKNGMDKHMNMALLERAMSMLSNAKLQQKLWVEAITTT